MFRTALTLLLSFTLIAQPAAAFAHHVDSSESKTMGVSTGVTGISPSFSPGFSAEDKASSQTLATVLPGAIITGEPGDLSGLNRDKTKAHQKLEKIFDLEALKEDTEAAKLFAEAGFRAAGDLANVMGWEEGSPEKVALHAAVGGAVAAIAGGNIAAGAGAAALNDALLPYLIEALDGVDLTGIDKDAILVLTSQAIGGLVSGANGAAITGKATKDNYLTHKEALEREIARKKCAGGDGAACQCARTLDELDQERDRQLIAACATGGKAGCRNKVNDLFAALQSYHKNPQENHPDEAAYRQALGDALPEMMAEYEGSASLRKAVHELIRSRSSAELGQMLLGSDIGAVVGASAAVLWASVVGGAQAARTIIATCGKSATCYAHYGQKLLAEIAAAPELGGTGIATGAGFRTIDDFIRNNRWRGGVPNTGVSPQQLSKLSNVGRQYYQSLRGQNVRAIDAYKAAKGDMMSVPYAPRVRQRAVEDPGGHNFPRSVDQVMFEMPPVVVRGGGLGYAVQGTRNGKPVVFNVIVKGGQITHRDAVSASKWSQRTKSFGWPGTLNDVSTGTVNWPQ